MTTRILTGDCRDVLRTLDPASMDACVTDPPYHLTANKAGGTGEASLNLASPAGRSRITTGGFMGKAWDGGDVAFRSETWAEVLRVLKPGAHLIAFGGTRTYHRLACAIEDAGFEIRDQIAWLYGSGFPKSHNLHGDWEGWGTALKPACEPIVLARKPLIGTVAENISLHHTGAINVDACRVEAPEGSVVRMEHRETNAARGYDGGLKGGSRIEPQTLGRWPANVIHDGSEEVLAAFPETKSGGAPSPGDRNGLTYGEFGERSLTNHGANEGSAARFFYCAKASRADRDDGLGSEFEKKPLLWSSGEQSPGTFQSENTDRSARNAHPTVKPTDLMRWLVRLVTPPGGVVLDPFMGSGSTGRGCAWESFSFVGIEAEAEYIKIAEARIAAAALAHNDSTRQASLFTGVSAA